MKIISKALRIGALLAFAASLLTFSSGYKWYNNGDDLYPMDWWADNNVVDRVNVVDWCWVPSYYDRGHVAYAASSWNLFTNTDISLADTGDCSKPNALASACGSRIPGGSFSANGRSEVAAANIPGWNFAPNVVYGISCHTFDSEGRIRENDIIINSGVCNSTENPCKQTLAHEFGHMLGLDHPNTSEFADCNLTAGKSIMCQGHEDPNYVDCDFDVWCFLPHADDIQGVLDIYGDPDSDGCDSGDELSTDPQRGGRRNPVYFWDFFDLDNDNAVTLSDTLIVLDHFGHTHDNDVIDVALDRYQPDPANRPWLSAQAFDGIDLADALTSNAQFGHDCGNFGP